MTYIGLLDCNNFFVSCERLFRPDLVGKAVVVLSGNDGCVVARSNEVKNLGVPMGIPYFQVKKELTEAGCAIFSSNFTLYRDISRRVMEVLREESTQVEQYSVDEAFFKLQVSDNNQDNMLENLTELKRVVEMKIGIPVSIGAAKTKTIAKYAAEKEKRGCGVCVLTDVDWQAEQKTLSMNTIWGVGAKTSAKMRSHGIVTVADFLSCDRARIEQLFGIDGLRKREELSERAAYRLGDKRGPQKSIMSTRSFKNTTTEKSVVADALAHHIAQAAEELRGMNMKASNLRILAQTNRHSDWVLQGGSAEVVLDQPTNDTRVLLKEANRLLEGIFAVGVPYKKAGVILSGFRAAEVAQLELFAAGASEVGDAVLMSVLDELNTKFGHAALTIGKLGRGSDWQGSRKFVSPHYTTAWGEIPTIRTN